MAQDASSINYLQKLSTLIEGYQGYRSPKQRIATAELFEAFLCEKLKTILKIIEERYNDLINEKKNLNLLIPLSNMIKNLTDSFHYATYERSQRLFFLHEYKFFWPDIEENLCKIDYTILQYISMLVDKISRFEEESKTRFEDFSAIILMFRDKLSDRKKFIYGINEKLVPVNQLLHSSINDLRERHISELTFKNISKAIELFPDRINTYMDLFQAIYRYSSYYLRVNENIPLMDFFETAKLFISKYKQYINLLQQFLKRVRFETDDEKECEAYLQERIIKAPDFEKLLETLEYAHHAAEKKQAQRKEKEEIIRKATVEYQRGLKFEKELRFVEAIALYQITLSIDDKYPEAIEGTERCKKKQKALPAFIKAQKKIYLGQISRAVSLLRKVLKKAPEFEEARAILEKLEKPKAP
ncbi:MAG: hypothetical protein JW928_02880 [Candidatus Aureabacteria bacterium]|nr:hypothetical protein [Candidatus Auribacterota bacterium]